MGLFREIIKNVLNNIIWFYSNNVDDYCLVKEMKFGNFDYNYKKFGVKFGFESFYCFKEIFDKLLNIFGKWFKYWSCCFNKVGDMIYFGKDYGKIIYNTVLIILSEFDIKNWDKVYIHSVRYWEYNKLPNGRIYNLREKVGVSKLDWDNCYKKFDCEMFIKDLKKIKIKELFYKLFRIDINKIKDYREEEKELDNNKKEEKLDYNEEEKELIKYDEIDEIKNIKNEINNIKINNAVNDFEEAFMEVKKVGKLGNVDNNDKVKKVGINLVTDEGVNGLLGFIENIKIVVSLYKDKRNNNM